MATTMNASLWTNDRFYFWQATELASKDVHSFFEHVDEDPSRLRKMLQQSSTTCKISKQYDHILEIEEEERTPARAIAKKIDDALTNNQQILVRTTVLGELGTAISLEVMFGSTPGALETFITERDRVYASSETEFTGPETLLGRIHVVWRTTQEGIK